MPCNWKTSLTCKCTNEIKPEEALYFTVQSVVQQTVIPNVNLELYSSSFLLSSYLSS